ncbi:hypothetical protein AMJ99_CH03145 [Rhizobium esperanzae]|nr:hypothetical protein AMJ99_CH03145 [Rhizobium esperanzae]ANM35512.1 hypothetical protein AMK04_CH03149 [Rhizobium sp. N871]
MSRGDLTELEWRVLKNLLPIEPENRGRGRPPEHAGGQRGRYHCSHSRSPMTTHVHGKYADHVERPSELSIAGYPAENQKALPEIVRSICPLLHRCRRSQRWHILHRHRKPVLAAAEAAFHLCHGGDVMMTSKSTNGPACRLSPQLFTEKSPAETAGQFDLGKWDRTVLMQTIGPFQGLPCNPVASTASDLPGSCTVPYDSWLVAPVVSLPRRPRSSEPLLQQLLPDLFTVHSIDVNEGSVR